MASSTGRKFPVSHNLEDLLMVNMAGFISGTPEGRALKTSVILTLLGLARDSQEFGPLEVHNLGRLRSSLVTMFREVGQNGDARYVVDAFIAMGEID